MTTAFKAVKISDSVYWVGAIDWSVRNFHGYLTSRGTTYNAFLIMADKITLIDTVKPGFGEEMMSRIASIVEPEKIDYIISNHAEMDHSGFLPEAIERIKPEKVFASSMGKKALDAHFHWDQELEVKKTGDKIDLGNKTLSFVEARMLHWPDSMFSYLEEEKILFTNDVFGMHLATSERFADEVDDTVLYYEASKYYANIILHLSHVVTNFLDRLPSFNLDIAMIAPDHGPIWREEIGTIVDWYAKWAKQEPTNKAVVVFDSMWESTTKMARAVGDGLTENGAAVKLMPLGGSHRSDVVTEILDAGALLVGSPTINNQVYPTVADVMNYLKGLKPKNLVGGVFGSFGWSGEATKHLAQTMEEMDVELVGDPAKVKYVPNDEALATCRELGAQVAARMKEKVS